LEEYEFIALQEKLGDTAIVFLLLAGLRDSEDSAGPPAASPLTGN
jgi:hypothetical protein